jgi:hypothetical protein
MTAERYIEVLGWERFQHYKDRDPAWIKNYVRLLHNDAYLDLTLHQRGVLHGLWILYAANGRQIRDSTATVSRQLGGRVSRATLEALNDAGFIRIVDSKPLAPRYQDASPEVEVLRTSTKSALARARRSGSRASAQSENSVCPECQTGGGFHILGCSRADG